MENYPSCTSINVAIKIIFWNSSYMGNAFGNVKIQNYRFNIVPISWGRKKHV